jgi:DNA-binding transcriptional LysR family regulator
MDVKTLHTLIAIVDHRGFAAAGRAVGLSPSGVSLQIKALEEEFGLRLFDRTARPPRLTSEGELFVGRAREVVAQWERLTDRQSGGSLTGVLDLGAVPTIVSGNLPLALRRLRDRNPDLRIRLTTGLSHELEALLRRGALDAAALTQPVQVPAGLTWSCFCQEPLAVIAPRGTAGERDQELLRAGPFIRFRRYAWAGRLIDEELRRRGIQVAVGMEVDSLEGIVSLVAHGLGVSVVPRRNIDQPFPAEVKVVDFGTPAVTRALGILQRVDNPRAHFVQQLFDELAALSRPMEETAPSATAAGSSRPALQGRR